MCDVRETPKGQHFTELPTVKQIGGSAKLTTIVAQEQESTSAESSSKGHHKMGRKKIQISRICDERNRQVTFTKRKFGLMKKAYELSILCDCEIALIIFNGANKLFQYASTDMDKVLLKYTEYNEPHESRTNKDIIEALNKKEHKGCDSPDPESDPYSNTMTQDEKYNRMNDEYQRVLQQNSMRHTLSPYQNPNMPPGVTTGMPLHNSAYMNQSLPGHGLAPQHPQLSSSPALLQPPPMHPSGSPRPHSTGNMVDLSGSSPANSFHRASPCPSPGSMVNKSLSRQSPPSRGPPNMCGMIPNSRNDMLSPDVQQRPSSANLISRAAVSLTTPSIQTSNYPSPLQSSYHPNDYGMNTAELTGMSNYTHHQWGNPHQGSLTSGIPPGGLSVPPPGANAGHVSPLAVNTMNQGIPMHIKSEPISPPRDSTSVSSNHHSLRPPSQGQGHLSPVHQLNQSHSNNSSPTGTSHSLDYDGPLLKRPRVDGWAT